MEQTMVTTDAVVGLQGSFYAASVMVSAKFPPGVGEKHACFTNTRCSISLQEWTQQLWSKEGQELLAECLRQSGMTANQVIGVPRIMVSSMHVKDEQVVDWRTFG